MTRADRLARITYARRVATIAAQLRAMRSTYP